MKHLSIAGRLVGPGQPPYIIAEMSANHGGSLDRAKKIIRLAAEAGADSIKLQAYTADSITLNHDGPGFTIESESLWHGRRLHDLYDEACTPYAWFPELFNYARSLGITPFATPFDPAAVAMLQELDAPAYKIASFEAVDIELIKVCARTGKPMIISTGMCNEQEIADAIDAARSAGATEISILKCTSAYPATAEAANIASIPAMERRFDVVVGISDHTLGTVVSAAACALGACLVEKHVIDAAEPPTADSAFSLLPDELKRLVSECRDAWSARGTVHYGPIGREKDSLQFRRSLYSVRNISAGEALTRENVRSVRPGYGLAPKHLEEILGRKAKADIPFGTPLSWEMLGN
ncbi:MAG: pseudaminic acid synthase [Ferrovibrio sp.]